MPTLVLILSGLTGAVIGTRLKVFVLIPTICLVILAIAIIGASRGDGLGPTALNMFCSAIGLQFGYLFGNLTRFVLAANRAPRLAPAPRQSSPSRVRQFFS